ncbi:MAG: ribosome small subunit-dependent GTPase A [Pyrinomonadaceae bacterium]
MNFTELEKLGFGDWFERHSDSSGPDQFQLARVTEVHKESYVVTDGVAAAYAETTGKLMFAAESPLDYPTVGDWCRVQFLDDNSLAIIHGILPRKSILKRKTSGKKVEFQAIAANIDTAFIIQSLNADFNLRRLERYLVMVREGNIEPAVLLSKSDLLPPEDTELKKEAILETAPGVPVVSFSNIEAFGLEEIEKLLAPGRTFCLLGSSGVGKTTLLNNLLGADLLETKAIREKDDKGRHTTTGRQLLMLENGAMIIDTPGMRELGNIGVEAGIGETFDDIAELETLCRFSDCTHTKETECAVLGAIEDGTLSEERFQNYAKMLRESMRNEMSYAEQRRRNKRIGKFYKSVQKNNKKNF